MRPLFRTVATPRARRHIRIAARWWLENRSAAPDLFERELAQAFDRLSKSPDSGRQPRHKAPPGTLYIRMPKTGYLLYYRPEHGYDLVVVLAVWHENRLSPRL